MNPVVDIDFGPGGDAEAFSLSGADSLADHLFLAPDEGAAVVRFRRDGTGRFASARSFALADLVDLPGDPGDEADLEGLAIADGALWLVGSHGNVRKRVPDGAAPAKVPDLLAELKHPTSRCLLARIPLADADDGSGSPAPTPVAGSAARLPSKGAGSLREVLADDVHLGPFLAGAGKENGLDIEGIAVTAAGVLLGLRGPVLRGWAVILRLDPEPDPAQASRLRLADLPGGGAFGKHFLDLDGLGIRDLATDGDDLLILSGPTMLLDGPTRILRLPGAAAAAPPVAVHRSSLVQVGPDLATGHGEDHPEAVTVLGTGGQRQLLVVYDSPAANRIHDRAVRADLHPLA